MTTTTATSSMPPARHGEILELVRSGVARTRAEIQEATGLSRVTVGQRVEALLAANLLREAASVATGGRRAKVLEFNIDHQVVLSASLNTRHVRVGVLRLDGTILASADLEVDIQMGPEPVLDSILDAAGDLLNRVGRRADDVAGVGISIPGPVDPVSARPNQPPIMSAWDGFDIREHVQRRHPGPVVVENDANAMAVGERIAGGEGPQLLLLKASTGIGAGIVINGDVYPGFDGGAGDIGHMRIGDAEHGRICRCGARGCLAASASGGAIAAELRTLGHPEVLSARDVVELLEAGDPDAIRLVRSGGEEIGRVLAAVICVLNPQTLVIGGDLASAELKAAITAALLPLCMPRATQHLRVRLALLGEDAALVGLAHLVTDEAFSPMAVNEKVAA